MRRTMDKKNKKEEASFDKLAKMTTRELVRHKPGYYVIEGDDRILMPMQTALMHSDMSKVQQNIVLAVIEAMKEKLAERMRMSESGLFRDLFAEQELADDDHPIKFKLLFKDFGVSCANYPKLAAAMRMMSKIPVEFPYKGNSTGRMYTKSTNFCDVYIPEGREYLKYCIVSMSNDVAERLLKFDLGYLYVGKLTSWKMSTKYSERLYWYIKAFCNNGGITESMTELRKLFGAENKFLKSGNFERNVIQPSAEEIKQLYDRGECECWFEYEKIYNNGRKHGEPDAIRFRIHSNKNKENIISEATDKVTDEICSTMREDIHISEELIRKYVSMLTKDNKERFLSQLITIKMQLDQKTSDKQPLKNRTAYIVKALNNFFAKGNDSHSEDGNDQNGKAKTVDKHSNLSYRDRWAEVLQKLAQYLSEQDMDDYFGKVSFGSFDADSGKLMLNAASKDVCLRIENSKQIIKLLYTFLREYYNFKQFNWLVVKKEK